MTAATAPLDALPRHETAHGALLADIVDVLGGSACANPDKKGTSPADDLSPSELRVLRYLPTNLTRSEVAQQLYVSVNTVNTHVRNIGLSCRGRMGTNHQPSTRLNHLCHRKMVV
jgi:LuxR family transcriptional regulator, maltose regulon positive regulatory protein